MIQFMQIFKFQIREKITYHFILHLIHNLTKLTNSKEIVRGATIKGNRLLHRRISLLIPNN